MSPAFADWVQTYGEAGLCAAAFVGATLVPISSEAAFVAAVAAGLDPASALLWATLGNTAGCLVELRSGASGAALGVGAAGQLEGRARGHALA